LPLTLKIELNDETKDLKLIATEPALKKFSKEVIRRARISLANSKTNSSGNLSNSLASMISVDKDNKISLVFDAPDAPYYEYVDKGVQGKISGAKAPDSPFKFGSGKGERGGLTKGIRNWIKTKPIPQWKNKKTGRFMSYDAMGYLITKSVYLYGLEPKYYYTNALERTFNKYVGKIEDAIIEDYQEFFEDNFSSKYKITIEI